MSFSNTEPCFEWNNPPYGTLKKLPFPPKSWFSLILITFYQCNLMKTDTKPRLPKSIKPLNDSKGIYNTLILCCHLAVICIFAATFLKASTSFPSSLLWIFRFNYLVIISQRPCFLEKLYVIGDWFHVKGEMNRELQVKSRRGRDKDAFHQAEALMEGTEWEGGNINKDIHLPITKEIQFPNVGSHFVFVFVLLFFFFCFAFDRIGRAKYQYFRRIYPHTYFRQRSSLKKKKNIN